MEGQVSSAAFSRLLQGAAALIFAAQGTFAGDKASFKPSVEQGFGDALPALRHLVSATPTAGGVNHFCIIGYRETSGPIAWVHWREAGHLVLWQGPAPGVVEDDSLLHSNRNLDLSQDVVETEAEIAGSTYLVTRAWVNEKLGDCAADGDRYTLAAPGAAAQH